MYVVKIVKVSEDGTAYQVVARLADLGDAIDKADEVANQTGEPVIVDVEAGSQGTGT